MTVAQPLARVSVAEYLDEELRSEIKHDYVDGRVYARTETLIPHKTIATNLCSSFWVQLRGKPCHPFTSDAKIRLRLPTETRFYYPDAMVVRHPNQPSESFQDRPVMIAEVMTEESRRIDEWEKKDAYLTIPSLTAYLLIESDRPRVVVYRRTEMVFVPEVYQGMDATIELKDVRCSIALSELYERVDFTAATATEQEADAD